VPWQELSVMESRLEFVRLAGQAGLSFSRLCARFATAAFGLNGATLPASAIRHPHSFE
jgi:hypothetical protein